MKYGSKEQQNNGREKCKEIKDRKKRELNDRRNE